MPDVDETHRTYTPQEAAALTGVSLQRIQNALTERRLGQVHAVSGDGRRHIDLPAILTFAALDRLGAVKIEAATLYRAFVETGPAHKWARVTEYVKLDSGRLLKTVLHNVVVYERARKKIVSDPDVMGGLPVVKGTRIPARTLHARVIGGDTIESILDDYPYLDAETIEAAVMFAKANPERGRPKRKRPPADD